MLQVLKNLIKQTPPGRAYLRRKFWSWTGHDEKSAQFYAQFVRPGDLVFDVGANRGNRARLFLKLGARVVLVEPQPFCAAYLRTVLAGRKDWILVEAGLGPAEGEQEMFIDAMDVRSTFSADWIERTKTSGRFADGGWEKRQVVRMSTFDALIRQHGLPAFAKIDVEGYEENVLAGLHAAPGALSFEFTPEIMASTHACLDRISSLGDYVYQVSLGESMELDLPEWVSEKALRARLAELAARGDALQLFGDIYARLKP